MYDQYGEDAIKNDGQGMGGVDPFDIFNSFFGGGGGQRRQQKTQVSSLRLVWLRLVRRLFLELFLCLRLRLSVGVCSRTRTPPKVASARI